MPGFVTTGERSSIVYQKYFVDVFGEIVSDVRLIYDTQNNLAPYYLHGHPRDILRILTERDQSRQWKYKKYPAIILFQDFPESKGTDAKYETVIASCRALVLNETKQSYEPEDRYEKIFKPFLYPMYEQLLESMAESSRLDYSTADQIPHTKTDRLFWGREGIQGPDGLIFNDYLDAIDITFTNIPVLKKSGC